MEKKVREGQCWALAVRRAVGSCGQCLIRETGVRLEFRKDHPDCTSESMMFMI